MAGGQKRELWGTRIGVILAVAGSAVGLGNFLRFPGQAAQNGGGAFLLPYFVSLLVLGIPLCWAEWTMGRYGGTKGFNSAPGVFSVIWRNPLAKYFGGLALLIPLIIYMYYVLIEAWCLGYAINYLTGNLMVGTDGTVDMLLEDIRATSAAGVADQEMTSQAYSSFFERFAGTGEDGSVLTAGRRSFLLVLGATFVFNFVLIYRGVNKGIETFCKIAMPIMIILAVIVLIRVMTLGTPDPTRPDQSVVGGLGFMWNPQPEKLLNAKTWLAASGQIFFSLSVGFGIIINYASYLRENDDVVLSGLTSSSMNEFFEVCLGGMITLPASFIFLGIAAGSMGTFDLGFKALPNVFALMPAGQFFGFLWFFMLFVAAVTSSVSMLQPVIAFLEEGFDLKRHASVTILGLVTAMGCFFVVYFSKGLTALDTFDFWVGSVLIFILAMVQALFYGWAFGITRVKKEAHRGAHLRIPRFVQWMLKFVVPVYLLVIFVGFCTQNLPSSDERLFDTKTTAAAELDSLTVSEELAAAFTANEADLPEDFRVRSDIRRGEARQWRIEDASEALVYRIRQHGDTFVVLKHNAGYVETIGNSPAALSAIIFIGINLTFLLVLIHIAGRRWRDQGRFDF